MLKSGASASSAVWSVADTRAGAVCVLLLVTLAGACAAPVPRPEVLRPSVTVQLESHSPAATRTPAPAEARESAIHELEATMAGGGEPKPASMLRLAVLYEERARDSEAQPTREKNLEQAIVLYREIARTSPTFAELATVYLLLGQAYVDLGRVPEGQQVWRSLVCHNRFPYPTAPVPSSPGHDSVLPLPQDHDETYWTGWRRDNLDAKHRKRGGAEATYVEVFPASCEPIVQSSTPPSTSHGSRTTRVSLAEIWWRIGTWELDQLDRGAGYVRDEPSSVYGYNRAASAFVRALEQPRSSIYAEALYQYGVTLFEQQRYRQATIELVRLLRESDEPRGLTDRVVAFRSQDAFRLVASALLHVDFEGPGPDEPYIMRDDILDTEPLPAVIERTLHVAVERVRDASLIPQDRPWSIEVHRALGRELVRLTQLSNAIEVYTTMLGRWPLHPTAPDTHLALIEVLTQRRLFFRRASREHREVLRSLREARERVVTLFGAPWIAANRGDPAALRGAEAARADLRAAALQNTKEALAIETEAASEAKPTPMLEESLARYDDAISAWEQYIATRRDAAEVSASRTELAKVRRDRAAISTLLGAKKSPPASSQRP